MNDTLKSIREYKQLQLSSPFPWGKYKGQPLSEVIRKDMSYITWLRATRWKDIIDLEETQLSDFMAGFSAEVHELMDINAKEGTLTLSQVRAAWSDERKRRFKEAEAAAEEYVPPANQPKVTSEGWGAWT